MSRYIDADKVLYFFPDFMDSTVGEDYARGWNHCKEMCIHAVEIVCDMGLIQPEREVAWREHDKER